MSGHIRRTQPSIAILIASLAIWPLYVLVNVETSSCVRCHHHHVPQVRLRQGQLSHIMGIYAKLSIRCCVLGTVSAIAGATKVYLGR